jgi:hypothetical protein
VSAVHIGGELVKKIALVRDSLGPEIPEVMMWVADRDFELQCGFLRQGQPVVSSIGHRGSFVCFNSPLLRPTA